jgi:Uma2 family endonuclease
MMALRRPTGASEHSGQERTAGNMAEPAKKRATYDDLYGIPENMTGEIIGGELIVTPRPSRSHGYTAYSLGGRLTPYHFGEGRGPGGWIILMEPEIKLGQDTLVPDLAGWKEERFPETEDHNWISVPPDWICEVLSPGTVHKDRVRKMPIYAGHGVQHLWLINPRDRTLDVFRLESGRWVVLGVYAEDDNVRAEPFQEVEIALASLWLEVRRGQPSH